MLVYVASFFSNMNHTNSKYFFKENIKADYVRWLVNLTVEAAKGFDDCNNIYVRYWLDVPEGWQVTENSPTHGFTHQSRVRHDATNHFGQCFTLDISSAWQHNQECFKSPQLLFEVVDVNLWDRQKSVGYGFTNLRLEPGCRSEIVSTWRPELNGVGSHLREHFLGLAPQIEGITYAGVPNNDGIVARFPFRTISSGTIQLRFDTIVQKGKDVMDKQQLNRTPIVSQRVAATSTAVDEVIQAYHRAKQRLKAAHESLLR